MTALPPRPAVSFEFFPPKSLDQSFKLWETARTLAPLGSDFVSVTYGAGGTTRQLTHEAVVALSNHYHLELRHLRTIRAIHVQGIDGASNHGDSGGPLVINGQIVGVCSTGDTADPGSNIHAGSNYSNITGHRAWIRQTAGV